MNKFPDPLTNISFFDLLLSRYHYFDSLKLYRKAYKNYLRVIWDLYHSKYPINAILKNGEEVILKNYLDVVSATRGKRQLYDLSEPNSVSVKLENGKKLKFFHLEKQFSDIFLNESYPFLPVQNKVVIDIGGYIADSAIYFVVRGAKKVISLEPFMKNYQLAKKNIKINNLENKIDFLLAGCGSCNKTVQADPNPTNLGGAVLREVDDGLSVPIFTLDKILDYTNGEASILKLNCEGCEYDVILSSSKEILRRFSHMVVEYHYGYKNLIKKLISCGFKVSHTRPRYYRNKEIKTKMYHGQIHATLSN